MTEGDPDVICVVETHLRNDSTLAMHGYRFYGLNHDSGNSHIQGSGGIGIFVKNTVQTEFKIEQCYEHGDNVLGLSLENMTQKEQIVIYCVYLPLDSSKYGQDNKAILNSLTVEVYKHSNADQIFICGDFNARIGKMSDCLIQNELPRRVVLDEGQNIQGKKLVNFVSDIRGCVLNGQVTPEKDFYTSMTRYCGKAVVDYHITRDSDLDTVVSMEVISCVDLVNKNKLEYLLSERCHILDHNLMQMVVERSATVSEKLYDKSLGAVNIKRQKVQRKTGSGYMESDIALKLLPEMLHELSNNSIVQSEIDDKYNKLLKLITEEAERLTAHLKKKWKKYQIQRILG